LLHSHRSELAFANSIHFLDKQHLLLSGFGQLLVELSEQQRTAAAVLTPRGLSFSLGMFEHVQGYLQVYRALVGKQSGALVAEHLQQMVTDLVRDELAALVPRGDATPIPLELVVQYTVSAFLGLLTWWG
jgi:hypothetical protein